MNIRSISNRYSKWMLYRRTVAELQKLSDRELNDLGLGRGSINEKAHTSVYGA